MKSNVPLDMKTYEHISNDHIKYVVDVSGNLLPIESLDQVDENISLRDEEEGEIVTAPAAEGGLYKTK